MRDFLILLISFLVGAGGGALGARFVYHEALERIEMLSPVVVLDATPMLESIQVRSSPEEIATVLQKVRDQAERLKGKGFVVLKPSAVMATPEAVYVKVDPSSSP